MKLNKGKYQKTKLLKNMPNIAAIVIEILYFHTNTNGPAFHADIM